MTPHKGGITIIQIEYLPKLQYFNMKCNAPVLTPLHSMYMMYILNDHGVELKAKAPPLVGYAMFWDLNCCRWYIGACGIYYDGHHVKYESIIKINTTSYGRGNQIEWGMIS